jgi:hypothetical protein
MFGSLLPLLVASAAVASALPGPSASKGGENSGNLPRGASNDAVFHVLEERNILGPISTNSAAGIAGGQIACDAPPVSSFFAGLKPPVRIRATPASRPRHPLVLTQTY